MLLDYARATARTARSFEEWVARCWRPVNCVPCLMRPALLRVDLREGLLISEETSSAGPPLGRFEKLRCALPVPVTPLVAAFTVGAGLWALGFFGFGRLLSS